MFSTYKHIFDSFLCAFRRRSDDGFRQNAFSHFYLFIVCVKFLELGLPAAIAKDFVLFVLSLSLFRLYDGARLFIEKI